MSAVVNINGKLCKPEEAFINVFDRAVLYGDGVYETLRTYEGEIFLYEEHFRRLQSSLNLLSIKTNYTSEELYQEIIKTIKAANNKESMIRLIISRGVSPISLKPNHSYTPTLIIVVQPYEPFPEDCYKSGVNLIISEIRRNPVESLNPAIKSLNLLNNFLAYKEAMEKNAFDAILLNTRGYVAEGTTFNVFWVKNDVLYTPSEKVGILLGITRDLILNLSEKMGIKVKKGFYRKEEILNADESFITSTLKEIIPVRMINGKQIGKICPGNITRMLMKSFKEEIKKIIMKTI